MSVRQDIINAVIEYLNTNRPPDVPEARDRRPAPNGPITESEINVFMLDETTRVKGGAHGPLYQKILTVIVECRDVTTDPEAVNEVVEPLLIWASRALNNSDSLGRRATNLMETGVVWVPVYMEKIYATARMSFSIEYQVNRKDPNLNA